MNPTATTTTTDDERARWGAVLDAREAVLAADLRTAAAEVPGGRDDADSDRVRAPACDRIDIADERLQNGLRYAEAERDMAELRDIAAARERLANGEFGRCIDCGNAMLAHASRRCTEHASHARNGTSSHPAGAAGGSVTERRAAAPS
jgi:DnaK suppressor protein